MSGVEIAVQVLEVAAREIIVGNDLDLALALLGDLDGVAEVADAALNLDLLVQELLEGRDVEDLVAGGLGSVDDELQRGGDLLATAKDAQNLRSCKRLTFLVTLGPFLAPDFFCCFPKERLT
jgi:hypothetical protein